MDILKQQYLSISNTSALNELIFDQMDKAEQQYGVPIEKFTQAQFNSLFENSKAGTRSIAMVCSAVNGFVQYKYEKGLIPKETMAVFRPFKAAAVVTPESKIIRAMFPSYQAFDEAMLLLFPEMESDPYSDSDYMRKLLFLYLLWERFSVHQVLSFKENEVDFKRGTIAGAPVKFPRVLPLAKKVMQQQWYVMSNGNRSPVVHDGYLIPPGQRSGKRPTARNLSYFLKQSMLARLPSDAPEGLRLQIENLTPKNIYRSSLFSSVYDATKDDPDRYAPRHEMYRILQTEKSLDDVTAPDKLLLEFFVWRKFYYHK